MRNRYKIPPKIMKTKTINGPETLINETSITKQCIPPAECPYTKRNEPLRLMESKQILIVNTLLQLLIWHQTDFFCGAK